MISDPGSPNDSGHDNSHKQVLIDTWTLRHLDKRHLDFKRK